MSVDVEPPDPLEGTTVAGRYRIERRVAAGGMGVVYRARQEPLGRVVALKVMRSEISRDEIAAQRFEREAKAASALSDPHIVTVYDFGRTDDGALYIAMEFVEGETLRDALIRHGRMPWPMALEYIRQITRGLAAAHARGVVHRDLKPENVMLVHRVDDDVGLCKVLDFGLARQAGDALLGASPQGGRLTRSGGFVGTPGYLSPEAVNGEADHPRQDVYALGVIWWELLTGAHPFPAPTPMKTLLRQMHEDPPTLDGIVQDAPADGAALVRACMAKNAEDRPADATMLSRRLGALGATFTPPTAVSAPGTSPLLRRLGAMGAAAYAPPIVSTPPRGEAPAGPAPPGFAPAGAASSDGLSTAATVARGQRPVVPSAPALVAPDGPAAVSLAPSSGASHPGAPSSRAPSSDLPVPEASASTPFRVAATTSTPNGSLAPPASATTTRRPLAIAAIVGLLACVLVALGMRVGARRAAPLVVDAGVADAGALDAGAPTLDVPPVARPIETEVVFEGLPSFTALQRARVLLAAMPSRAFHFHTGRGEVMLFGDVGTEAANALDMKLIDVAGFPHLLEVKEVTQGRVVVTVRVPGAAELAELAASPDGGSNVQGVDGGASGPADAGVLAPGGIAP